MDFLYSLGIIVAVGIIYGLINWAIKDLDGYVYIKAALTLVSVLVFVFDYFLEWTGLTRLVFESYITGLAVLFFLPIYLLVKVLFYSFDPPYYKPPKDNGVNERGK